MKVQNSAATPYWCAGISVDRFRLVLGTPGHQDDLAAHELIAHQLARLNQNELSDSAYTRLIELLEAQPCA